MMPEMTIRSKNLIHLITVLLCLTVLTSCAKKFAFEKSVVVPEAEGRVKMKRDANKNYLLEVDVRKPRKDVIAAENT